jgi:hypothetical protein
MTTQRITIDVSVAPVEGLAPNKIDGGFTSTSVRKSYDDDEQIITCVAMVANEIDAHGDMFLPSAVKMAAHNFLARYNVEKHIGKQHDPDAEIDADLIGSFYTEKAIEFAGLDVPEFAWVSQIKINDSETWSEVKKAERTGVSIQGPAKGWVVDADVEKSIGVMLEKAKAHESKYTKPKRVFSEADPTNLDVVDAGANLHLLVWKARTYQMAEKTTETIATPVVKGLASENEEPKVETPAPAPEAKPTEVAKSETAPAPAPAPDVIGELTDGLTLLKAFKALDRESLALQLAALQKALGGNAPTPAPAPSTTEVAKSERDEIAELKAEIAKLKGETVEDENAKLKAELAKLKGEVEELSKAKVAPASGGDEPAPEVQTETEVAKKRFPGNKIDVDGQLSSILGPLTRRG